MTELQKQVRRVQWRLNIQRFLTAAGWCLTVAFLVAAVAIAIRKVWYLPGDGLIWSRSWLAGAGGVAVVAAGGWSWLRARRELEAAIELDRRFGLKERIASSLSLTEQDRQSEIGRALLDDANRRVAGVDIRQGFSLKPERWAWLPIVTGLVALAMVFIPDAVPQPQTAQASPVAVKQQIKNSAESLKNRLAKTSKEAEEKGLNEANKLITKLEQGVQELAKKEEVDKDKALVKLNDLAKEMKARREQLGQNNDLRDKLSQLKEMEIRSGPADKLSKAFKDGDFQAAMNQVKQLQDQLRDGSLTPEQQKQLAEQMQQMQDKLQQIVQAQQQARQELEKQIQQKMQQGDKQGAEKLAQQLNKLQMQDKSMQKLQKMAQQLGKASQNLQKGESRQAQAELAQLAQDLQGMQQELDEMQMLDEALTQLADAKDAMSCQECNGEGCASCQGGLGSNPMAQMPGMGLGEGQGQGDRPEEKTDVGFYDSKVAAKPSKGKMVVIGSVRGPNAPGEARAAFKEILEAGDSEAANPLTDVRLPRPQREQAQQYFDAVREGEN